jgi:hypothetical protein
MKLKYYLPVLIFILLLFNQSCNQTNSNKELFQKEKLIVKFDHLELPIDTNISSVGNYNNQYFEDSKGGNILVVPNLKNELVYFDLNQMKIIKKIKFQEEGADGIGRIGNFNFISMDSILIKGENPLETYCVNSKGKKISTFSTASFPEFQSREILGQPTTNISIFGKYVIQFAQALLLRDKINNKNYFDLNSKVFSLLNLTNGKYSFLPIKFPEMMHNKKEFWDLFHFTPSTSIIKEKFFYSFPGSDSLYFYNIKSKQIKQISAPSIYSKSGNGVLVKKFTTIEEYFEIYAQNYSYVKILSDKKHDRIFRIVAHPTQNWTKNGNLNEVLISKPFSIQIFDSNLNFLGETAIFSNNEHDFLDSFVGEKGLYISNNHPNNPKNDENKLSFTCYQLVKK